MLNLRQTVVLSGSGRKGVVKLSVNGGVIKGSCSLDFRPTGATLYLIGDEVASVPLKDITTSFEAVMRGDTPPDCVVRSSSLTMFGGNAPHSKLLERLDEFLKSENKTSRSPSDGKPARKSCDDPPASSLAAAGENAPRTANGADIAIYDDKSKSDNLQYKAEKGDKTENFADVTHFGGGEGALRDNGENSAKINAANKDRAHGDDPHASSFADMAKYDGNNFYYAIKPQLDEMFVRYPADVLLENSVQNSRWVCVDAVDGAYSVGILYDAEEPAFICYAVPEPRKDSRPPAEIENMCVWLPISSPSVAGYWAIYQSARTGDIIK